MPEHTPAPTPARSLYGFFLYLFCKTILWMFCVWAFTSDYYLHKINIYYYPQKYWSTAVPIQCLVALTMFAFFIYPSSNLILTPNINGVNTIKDQFSHFKGKKNVASKSLPKSCICLDERKCNRANYNVMPDCNESTVPQLHDIDVRYVCRKLYFNTNNVF